MPTQTPLKAFAAHETLALGIPNPGATLVVSGPPSFIEALVARALQLGIEVFDASERPVLPNTTETEV